MKSQEKKIFKRFSFLVEEEEKNTDNVDQTLVSGGILKFYTTVWSDDEDAKLGDGSMVACDRLRHQNGWLLS